MPLHKISDFDPHYHDTIQGNDVKGMGVYIQGSDEKVGSVNDVLVDDQGAFRYLIVDLGFWIFGKKVLLPIGRGKVDSKADRVYLTGMTRPQAEALPEYKEGMALDFDYEEKVRGVYRNQSLDASAPLETSAALDVATAVTKPQAVKPSTSPTLPNITPKVAPVYDRSTYDYGHEPDLYDVNHHEDQTFKLYEERLVANKLRSKAGEVSIGKHVETETARVSVPVDKERVVIERVTPADAGKAVAANTTAFREGEVARMDVYEETADIHKEAFVREEVKVSKVVDHETVEAQETLRREELDVDAGGRTIVDDAGRNITDKI